MQDEEWKRIEGFPEYEISSHGRVLSHHQFRPRIMRPAPGTRYGHLQVILHTGGRKQYKRVHNLVAEAFLGPRPPGLQTRHLDGNSQNNRVDNLAYGTSRENVLDAIAHGTHHNASKVRCPKGHPYDEANTKRYGNRRYCRSCIRDRRAAAREQLKTSR